MKAQLACLNVLRQLIQHGARCGLPAIDWTINAEATKITGALQTQHHVSGRDTFDAWRRLLAEHAEVTEHQPALREDLIRRASAAVDAIAVWLTIPDLSEQAQNTAPPGQQTIINQRRTL